jgi:nuclease S1
MIAAATRSTSSSRGGCGTSKSRSKNLHSVWDNCLLEAGLFERVRKGKGFKKTWGKNTITYQAVNGLALNTSYAEAKSFVRSAPWEWAAESYKITIDPKTLYCVQVGNTCQYSATVASLPKDGKKRLQPIDQAYLTAFAPIAENRVTKAGFRLAHLLNQALDPNYKEPIQKKGQKP